MWAARRTWFLAGVLACIGCRSNDVLENELRVRDNQYRDAVEELKKSECQNEALQRELCALRRGSKISPEDAARTFGLQRITLGRRTMGVDYDNLPGDEALQVVLEPRDVDDHVIKVAGTLQIMALEVSPQGTKALLSTWDMDEAQLRKAWKGFLITGYEFVLPWKNWPQYENVRVMARFTTTDGRVFEADKDIKVRIPPGLKPHREPPPGEQLPEPAPTPTVTHRQSCHWQPAPLPDTIQLGRPEPMPPGQ